MIGHEVFVMWVQGLDRLFDFSQKINDLKIQWLKKPYSTDVTLFNILPFVSEL